MIFVMYKKVGNTTYSHNALLGSWEQAEEYALAGGYELKGILCND